MEYNDFNPFYERLIASCQGGFATKILFSIFLGVIVLVAHFLSIEKIVFENNDWILSVLIIVATLCLFYATHTFRSLLPQLGTLLDSENSDIFKESIRNYLSDGKFMVSGVIFGSLNSVMGFLFGLPNIYNTFSEKFTILGAYFVAGFICGLAVLGIFGVTKCIVVFSKKSDTFIVGILISVYISNTVWENKNDLLVKILYYFWIIFPYLMSLFVLFIPAISINKTLTK